MNTIALILASAFSLWWVDPYGNDPYLPDAEPSGGVITNVLGCAAAKGEFESISFSVRPERDLKKVDFIPSDLTGPGGAKIPASCADFALVKCWYRAQGRWETSWSGHTGKPTLINDLILHDNDLVRVVEAEDYADRTILVRFNYADGPVWVDMRKHGAGKDHFRHEIFPVTDAKKFVPFDLKKDRFQQYWFTWKVPEDAKPGLYRGTLAVKEDGKDLDSIKVELEVYPFALPTPRTHYDATKRFTVSWMGTPSIAGELKHCKDLKIAEQKVFNIYKSLADHNADEPSGPGTFEACSTDDLAVRSLILMRQAGMDCDMLINGNSGDFGWAANPEAPFVSPEQDPELYQRVLEKYRKHLDVQAAVYDKYLGHRNNYFCGPDECGSYMHRRLYGFFTDIHRMGMDTWGDSGIAEDTSWSLGLDDDPAAARHTAAWKWHNASAKIVTYAATFSGPMCPDIWRRTKGLRFYYADFDGLHEYVLYYNRWNHWNDFKWRGNYTQMQIVYPVFDGIIETLAWQGMREGLDDIRYLSLLRLRALAAMKSSDPKVKALGRRNFVWMDLQDPERIIDLHAFRREVARRAAELVKVVGEEPKWTPLKPAPELPACTVGQGVEATAANAKDFAKKDRYDLAIPMWAKLTADASLPVDKRVEAAMEKAALEAEILRRDDAIKTIDAALGWDGVIGAMRGKLFLLRSRLMLTDRVFEEEYTLKQLNDAAAVLAKALALPGTSQKERFESIMKLANAYLAGGQYQATIDFVEARFNDTKLQNQDRCALYHKEAKAYSSMEKWDEAAKMYRIARQYDGQAHMCDTHEILDAEGWVAEQRQDWKTAQRCYGDQVNRFGEEDEDLKKACINKLNRVTKKLNESEKGKAVDMDDAMNGDNVIDLDE